MISPRNILAKLRLTPALIWSATAVGLLVQLSFFVVIAIGSYRATTDDVEKGARNIASLQEASVANLAAAKEQNCAQYWAARTGDYHAEPCGSCSVTRRGT